MAPSHIVGRVAEVVVAECLDTRKHGVDLGLLRDEGGQRLLSRLGDSVLQLATHLRGSAAYLLNRIKASSGEHSYKKIDPIVLFFDLTSGATYGWRAT
jgi:hypothetical protein